VAAVSAGVSGGGGAWRAARRKRGDAGGARQLQPAAAAAAPWLAGITGVAALAEIGVARYQRAGCGENSRLWREK